MFPEHKKHRVELEYNEKKKIRLSYKDWPIECLCM